MTKWTDDQRAKFKRTMAQRKREKARQNELALVEAKPDDVVVVTHHPLAAFEAPPVKKAKKAANDDKGNGDRRGPRINMLVEGRQVSWSFQTAKEVYEVLRLLFR